MRTYKGRTIARDLAFGLTLTIIIVTTVLSSLNYWVAVSRSERLLATQAEDLIERLSNILAFPLWNIDIDEIKGVTEAYEQTPNLVMLRIVDEYGETLYEKTALNHEERIFKKRRIKYGEQDIGFVEVALTKKYLLKQQRDTLMLTLVIMLSVVLSVAVVSKALLKKFLTQPLNKLTDGIERIASGFYSHRLKSVEQRDIDAIIQKVNVMGSQIGERDAALRESRERYKNLADFLPETVYEAGEDGEIVFFNRSGFKIFEYLENDLERGLKVSQLFISEDRSEVKRDFVRILASQDSGANEYTAKRRGGGTFPALVHSSPIVRNDKPVGLRGIVVDITDRKRREEELRKLAEGVAHQVRNPITTIGGFARRMQKNCDPGGLDCGTLGIIVSEVRRLEMLVSEIGRHASLPQPVLAPLSLQLVTVRVLDEYNEELRGCGVGTIRNFTGSSPEVLADAGLLELALKNIVDNARVAMQNGGSLEVSITRDENMGCVCFKDSGRGIAPEDLPHVFDPFFSSDPQACGLGLTTAERIIADQKGTIAIQSDQGAGTTVRVYLPLTEQLPPNA